MHWQGRDAVEQAHRAFFDLMFPSANQTPLATQSITPLPGGGAVVVARYGVGAFRQPNDLIARPARTG